MAMLQEALSRDSLLGRNEGRSRSVSVAAMAMAKSDNMLIAQLAPPPPPLCHRALLTLFLLSLLAITSFTAYKQSRALLSYKMETLQSSMHVSSVQPSTIAFWQKITPFPRSIQCKSHTLSCPLEALRQQPISNSSSSSSSCPAYFQWIYEDLSPWMKTGVSQNLILRGRTFASFRVLIVNGRLFVEPHRPCFQTRAVFTIWGIAQLLRYYPGLVPDVDLLFSCEDRPQIVRDKKSVPVPLFRYCSTPQFYDIPFPDWSFWGWPEINLGPWHAELADIVNGSQYRKWADRDPTAYWKGNPFVAPLRQHLLKCNSSENGAQIYIQDWIKEGGSGFNHSKLSDQCRNRYKIYAEGWGWSASLKYILACDSPVLILDPKYHDFFIRALVPQVSYWPVRSEYQQMCQSIKFAVNWGNSHQKEAEAIGKAGQEFISKEVGMPRVYDYMLHLLSEYSKLLMYKPVAPPSTQEMCSEFMLCFASPSEKTFMQQSQVLKGRESAPCEFRPRDLRLMRRMKDLKAKNMKKVEEEEKMMKTS